MSRTRPQAAVGGMVSSFLAFWILVGAVSSGDGTNARNIVLVLAAAAMVLLLVALWFPRGRAAALGAVAGLVLGTTAVALLGLAFGVTG